MDRREIKNHWENWAREYGTSLRATTKASTAKSIELDALARAFNRILAANPGAKSVLEVGSGNGENLLYLASRFPHMRFTGMDFVAEMIASAKIRRNDLGISAEHLHFLQGDVLDLPSELATTYDIVFTDRCLINLNTDDNQKEALSALCALLLRGGYLVMIENSNETYANQNRARELLDLAPRRPADFNHFFNEPEILRHLRDGCGMRVLDVEDFISLHDLVLYVLLPAINGGAVDYEHPLVQAATRLTVSVASEKPNGFGDFGQNRLYLCQKAE